MSTTRGTGPDDDLGLEALLDPPDDEPEPALPSILDTTETSGGASDSASGMAMEPPHPVIWDALSAGDAEAEWHALDHWVNWLRRTYGLPASIIPPLWHRHPELVWELSALHLHWLGAYDPQQHGSAPIGWHRDFAEARERLREWVALSGTKLDRDRPTRHTLWPGEHADTDNADHSETAIVDRDDDFHQFVADDLARRRSGPAEGGQ